VEGRDAAAKVVILGNLFIRLDISLSDIDCTGITAISEDDIELAKSQNKHWKLIGTVEKN